MAVVDRVGVFEKKYLLKITLHMVIAMKNYMVYGEV
jgi:hypothetical protein